MPCKVTMDVKIGYANYTIQNQTLETRVRYKWRENFAEIYLLNLGVNIAQNHNAFHETICTYNVNEATHILTSIISQAGECMKCDKNNNICKRWWDGECRLAKHEKQCMLLKYRSNKSDANRRLYVNYRNKFKTVCKRKKEMHKRLIQKRIYDSLSDTKRCWRTLKSLSVNDTSNSISASTWYDYFKDLLNVNVNVDKNHYAVIKQTLSDHAQNCTYCIVNTPLCLNMLFTNEEVSNVLKSFANNKAPGLDGIVIEMVKAGKEILLPYLVSLFNLILNTGTFPLEWSKAILMPLHKKGHTNDVNNYRGIALLSVLGKVFTKCLTVRLSNYYETQKLMFEEQAGFRRGHSTIDQLFILQTCVTKYLSKPNGRVYCAYIDFSKAFDSVSHDHLFFKLIQDGVHGKFLSIMMSMYSQLKSCIKVENGKYLSEWFQCKTGTRQGCMLSPTLFIIYLNIFLTECKELNSLGIYIDEQFHSLMLLLYADDMLEISDTVGRLQKLLNQLESFCSKWGLNVNLDKTKVMVFRHGGPLRRYEKWYYKGNKLEVVPFYKYVGLITTSRMNLVLAQKTLATQAAKTIFLVKKANIVSGGLMPSTLFKLFDKLILPILFYGSEIWGCNPHKCIETVQIKFLKYVLNVPLSAPNAAVLGDCGRYPVAIHANLRAVKYWLKVRNMSDDRLPKAALNLQTHLDEQGKNCWVTCIKNLLYKHGFGIVYIQGNVGDQKWFLSVFKERLEMHYKSLWLDDMMQNNRLLNYGEYKCLLETERYLSCINNMHFRKVIARFRCSCHSFLIETGRHVGIPRNERLCSICGVIEDEKHVIMSCVKYNTLRNLHLPEIERKHLSFINIMQSKDDILIRNLCKFLYAIM